MPRHTNTNVATDRGPFVGRAEELAAIDLAFSSGVPLITLRGAPGTGKTRLALRYAAAQRDELCAMGGVWFCDLTEARSSDDLAGVVASRLGVPLMTRASADAAARLGYALARRGPLLLVLDNFEQLPADAAELVERWVREAPQALVLVTSQKSLGLADEQVLEIGPLAAPDEGVTELEQLGTVPAVELFVTRARAVLPDYRLTAENAALVSALVRRLEGIPLGIELCAARIGVLGERQLLDLFEKQLDVPRQSRAGAPRHSTLRNAIDWSWQLLESWQRIALAQCSVFRGGFSIEAVEAVVDLTGLPGAPEGPLWATATLRGLADASLLRVYTTERNVKRYALLESVRQFASGELEQSGDRAAVAKRHRVRFAELARDWANGVEGPGGVELRHRLALEQGNVLAAYEHALAEGDAAAAVDLVLSLEAVYATRGPFGSYTSMLDAALEHADLESGLRARALASRGLLAILQGRLDDAAGDYASALELAERAGDGRLAALAKIKIGLCHGLAGRALPSAEWFARAEATLPTAPVGVQRAFFNDLGLVATQQGRTDDALAYLEKALELHQRTGHRRDEGVTLGNIGGRFYERGVLGEALDCYERSIEILRDVGDRRSAGVMLAHIGQVEQELGRIDSARSKLREALAIEREVGDWAWEGIVLGMLGNLELERGRSHEAAEYYRQSVVTLTGSSYRRNAGLSLAALAVAEAGCGRREPALRAMERARSLLAEAGSPSDRSVCDVLELAAELGDPEPAAQLRERAEKLHDELGSRPSLPDELRFALRVLRHALDRAPLARQASEPPPLLGIGPRARWFSAPRGERVDLSRRGPLRRLLLALAERRMAKPGHGLAVTELAHAAWPDAGDHARGMAARVYVGIGTLRRLGLADVLIRSEDGYLLDPGVEIELAEAAPSAPATTF